MKNIARKVAQSALAAPIAGHILAGLALAQTSASVTPPGEFFKNIEDVINSVLLFVFVIAVLLVFLYIVWGGITWITSGGDKGKTEEARNKITAAVVGLIILLASYAVLNLVVRFFTGGASIDSILDQTADDVRTNQTE